MKEIFLYIGGPQQVPKDVERVRVHPCVKVIERNAFEDCQKLKYVQFCDGLEHICDDAFRGCISLESIRMAPSMRSFGNRAFQGCTKLQVVILNEGMYMIGPNAFEHCISMEFLEFPSSTRYIQSRAFRGCSSLKEAFLNDGLHYIGSNAFELCTNLKAVTVPNCAGIHFGIGSEKWIRQWPVKDEAFWKLVSTNAHLVDMANMSKNGMLVAADADKVLAVMAEVETRHAQAKQYEHGLLASLESWKKTYLALREGPRKSLEPMDAEAEISCELQAMAIDSVKKTDRPRPTTRAPSMAHAQFQHQQQQQRPKAPPMVNAHLQQPSRQAKPSVIEELHQHHRQCHPKEDQGIGAIPKQEGGIKTKARQDPQKRPQAPPIVNTQLQRPRPQAQPSVKVELHQHDLQPPKENSLPREQLGTKTRHDPPSRLSVTIPKENSVPRYRTQCRVNLDKFLAQSEETVPRAIKSCTHHSMSQKVPMQQSTNLQKGLIHNHFQARHKRKLSSSRHNIFSV